MSQTWVVFRCAKSLRTGIRKYAPTDFESFFSSPVRSHTSSHYHYVLIEADKVDAFQAEISKAYHHRSFNFVPPPIQVGIFASESLSTARAELIHRQAKNISLYDPELRQKTRRLFYAYSLQDSSLLDHPSISRAGRGFIANETKRLVIIPQDRIDLISLLEDLASQRQPAVRRTIIEAPQASAALHIAATRHLKWETMPQGGRPYIVIRFSHRNLHEQGHHGMIAMWKHFYHATFDLEECRLFAVPQDQIHRFADLLQSYKAQTFPVSAAGLFDALGKYLNNTRNQTSSIKTLSDVELSALFRDTRNRFHQSINPPVQGSQPTHKPPARDRQAEALMLHGLLRRMRDNRKAYADYLAKGIGGNRPDHLRYEDWLAMRAQEARVDTLKPANPNAATLTPASQDPEPVRRRQTGLHPLATRRLEAARRNLRR